MDPMTLMLLSSLPQAALGLYQTGVGYLTPKPERPDFNIPGSQIEALSNARRIAYEDRMPGMSGIQGRLDRNTANTLSAIERMSDSPTSGINAAARAYSSQQEQEANLGVQAAEMALKNEAMFRNELHTMADWENKKNEWEQRTPYMQKMAQLSAMKGAGLTNLTGAAGDAMRGMATMSLMGDAKTGSNGAEIPLKEQVRFTPDLSHRMNDGPEYLTELLRQLTPKEEPRLDIVKDVLSKVFSSNSESPYAPDSKSGSLMDAYLYGFNPVY